jgi:hypothetical protein
MTQGLVDTGRFEPNNCNIQARESHLSLTEKGQIILKDFSLYNLFAVGIIGIFRQEWAWNMKVFR